jgi:hypothetical protein
VIRLLHGLGLTALLAACLLPLRAQEAANGNSIERLQAQLDRGDVRLAYDPAHGYLPAILRALAIPPESQVLPFTRSSFQFDLISPRHPRAVYFSDDVSVASVQDGRVLEVIVNNDKGGVAFYTFPAARQEQPRFQLEGNACIACHGMVGGRAVGWMVANITATKDGMPQFSNPARPFDFTDHTTPFELRWGGWYVTGRTGSMRHRGNVTARDDRPYDLPVTEGLNLASLSGKFDMTPLLQPGSDVVALMVLEHQTGFINRAAALNVLLSDENVEALVSYMTFADEVPLPDPVSGGSGFAAEFAATGPRDGQGRSLRTFDLKTRLFRYPLSYMITSAAFDGLRPAAKAAVWRRLGTALRATAAGREAMAIAAATKADTPQDWKTP